MVNEKLDEVYSIPSSDYRPPYNYTADRAADIPNIVPQWCGVGKIDDIQEGYPEITITKPAANAVITYEEGLAVDVEFTVTDEDGTVAEVTLAVDNAPADYEVSGNQYAARLENVALGRHTIEVKAADNDGHETARSLAFTVAEYTEMAVETLPATDVTAASAVLNGTFAANSDVVTAQGFVYGQLSKDQTHNSYTDIIGTKGIIRMTHDFKTAVVELRGVTQTIREERPYGGKNIDTLCRLFAETVLTGKRNTQLPTLRDSVTASLYAWKFLDDARQHDLPAIGNLETLEEIRERRRNMKNGYGLLRSKYII